MPLICGHYNSNAYHGKDNLHVDAGKGLPILHIGSSKNHSPNKSFHLSNLLQVPTITKHLLSVQQFFLHNNVFLEFCSYFFTVKDEATIELGV
uniref:Uncharacterized protein n=1 Tax=Lactuca sativa TaxID=4236 RepID=A0A9R1VDQ0_LACSA|nr:hypothetical protein LSAT_V11C500263330 [Lactuca sativa]